MGGRGVPAQLVQPFPQDKPGLTIELLKLVGQEAGVTFEIRRFPWNRCLHLLETNRIEAVFHSSFNKDRTAYGVYPTEDGDKLDESRAIYTSAYMIYKRAGSRLTWNGKAFGNLERPIGAQIGFAVIDKLEELGVSVDPVKGADLNLKKLINRRIDAYAAIESIADTELASKPALAGKTEKLPIPFITKPYFLMFSKKFHAKNTELVERIWNTIARVKAMNTFKVIESGYAE